MANMGKQQISSRQIPNLGQKKSLFEQSKFPQHSQNATALAQTNHLSDDRQPQPGEMIANVQKSLPGTDKISPKLQAEGNHLQAPKRQEREANFAPVNHLKASPRISFPMAGVVQTKLTIGRPNDRYEQEADRVAASVVQQINLNRSVPGSMNSGEVVQGKDTEEVEGLRMKPMVQRQKAIGRGEASTDLTLAINSAKGGGQPLDADLQQSMGQAMGADFSGVKVHTDAQSDQLNQSIQAKAFTTGQDVFFRQGAYEPASRGGQGLIAHELTHVVQQSGGIEQSVSRIQAKWIGDTLPTLTDEEVQTRLLGDYDGNVLIWKIKSLRTASESYSTIEQVAEKLKLKRKSSGELPESTSIEQYVPEQPLKAPFTPLPETTTPTQGMEQQSSFSQDSLPKKKDSESEEKEIAARYVVGKQIGNGGSHHTAYEIEGSTKWIFLVNDGTKAGIERTVANRKKAYSKFPESIIAKMGEIEILDIKGTPTAGVMLERMDGEAYHSTKQAWAMGMKKTVEKWREHDNPEVYKRKLLTVMAGMNTFISVGMVVDDFQYWVREDGTFMLSDVKSAAVGKTKTIHAELVNCLKQVETILAKISS
ncbi:eCIS core domain-containing protein [Nostoc sp.]|uniref:eCIS core domain-containing protein n=1 Tax=Nostoc sp. TaxID=1180 RepID=UPI002FF73283